MAALQATQNITVAFHDSLTTTICQVFCDSQIALKYPLISTKATCMLNSALAPFLLEDLASAMKHQVFSICINDSNDTGMKIMNPIRVRIYDVRSGKIVNCFVDICETTSATAKEVYTALNEKIFQLSKTSKPCTTVLLLAQVIPPQIQAYKTH